MVSEGGRAIKHPDFQDKHPALFSDNTHLSFIGNDIFLNSFQGAFETYELYLVIFVLWIQLDSDMFIQL